MSSVRPSHLNRRSFVAGAMAAAAAVPTLSRGQDSGMDANTATAQRLVETIEPILSYDTSFNLQQAIQNYEAFVAANGS